MSERVQRRGGCGEGESDKTDHRLHERGRKWKVEM